MPPWHVARIARQVGFAKCRTFPAPQHVGKALYAQRWPAPLRHLLVQAILLWQGWYCGIAILQKD
jgi:hypothetical protein